MGLFDTFNTLGHVGGLRLLDVSSLQNRGITAYGLNTLLHLEPATADFMQGNSPTPTAWNTSATEITLFGTEAGRELRYASDIVAIGSRAGRDNKDAYYGTFVGHYAGGFNINGWKDTFIGCFSGKGIEGQSNSHENTGVGFRTMYLIRTGMRNFAGGIDCLLKIDDAYDCTGTGAYCGHQATNLTGLSLYGAGCGSEITTGSSSSQATTIIGYQSGGGLKTGKGCTIIGAKVSGLPADLENNIILANGTGAIKAQHDGTNWVLTGRVTTTGGFCPPALYDAAVANGTVYTSLDCGKLVYKDLSGTVQQLH